MLMNALEAFSLHINPKIFYCAGHSGFHARQILYSANGLLRPEVYDHGVRISRSGRRAPIRRLLQIKYLIGRTVHGAYGSG